MCNNGPMAEDPVARATRRYRLAQATLDARRAELIYAVGTALTKGRKQTEIVETTGFTREHIRRLHRAYERAMAAPDPFADPSFGVEPPRRRAKADPDQD